MKQSGFFQRFEQKYILETRTYQQLFLELTPYMKPDQYGVSQISSIYFDTPDHRLIRNSLEKPVYKEKLRLRCYGSPKPQDPVFVELKKKYMGTVYKRRVALSLQAAESYLYQRLPPEVDSQVLREVDYMYSFYHTLIPTAYIAYQRVALYGLEDANLRVTFDWNLRWRCENLHLDAGTEGQFLLPEVQFLMEIKVPCAMPVWMARLLDTLQIFPTSFSKYGVAYQNSMAHGAINRNVEISMENGDKKGRIVYA